MLVILATGLVKYNTVAYFQLSVIGETVSVLPSTTDSKKLRKIESGETNEAENKLPDVINETVRRYVRKSL